jgi:hypothetical protein
MQQNSLAEKSIIYIDGEEIPGLIFVGETLLEKGTIEVPEFARKRIIQNGITSIPAYDLRYKIDRGTNTSKFFRDWFDNNEIKDVTVVSVDAHGEEFERTLLSGCECTKYSKPETDAANPTFAFRNITLIPWENTILTGA